MSRTQRRGPPIGGLQSFPAREERASRRDGGWTRYEAFAEVQIEMSERRDLGDGLVAIGRTRTRGKASGAEMERPLAFVTEIGDGKTISIWAYLDREEALEAAGLSE